MASPRVKAVEKNGKKKSKMGTETRDSPAQTTSPEGSTASDMNCAGSGLVSVLKLRYRMRSNARTVPSSDADTTAWPDGANVTAATGALCSVNVMKQLPVAVLHTFTLLSSAAVAIMLPSGAYAHMFTSK